MLHNRRSLEVPRSRQSRLLRLGKRVNRRRAISSFPSGSRRICWSNNSIKPLFARVLMTEVGDLQLAKDQA